MTFLPCFDCLEASKRAAPGDTLKELSVLSPTERLKPFSPEAILQALGDEVPGSWLSRCRRQSPRGARGDTEAPPPPPEPEEDGRGRGRSSASRRAAPGDTLREDAKRLSRSCEKPSPGADGDAPGCRVGGHRTAAHAALRAWPSRECGPRPFPSGQLTGWSH